MSKPKTIEERFWPKVEKSDGCWLWRGGKGPRGYGWISLGRKNDGGESAHRVSWRLHFGEIPDGMFVCHRCDVRRCVNPTHLFLGTHEDNMRDMREKGRAPSGDRHGRRINPACVPVGEAVGTAKLSDASVAEILATYFAGGASTVDLAARYGVAATTVQKIVRGEQWEHIPRPASTAPIAELARANALRARPRGAANSNAKLTAESVAEIRSDYAAGNVSQRALAARYGVTQTAIYHVLRGRSWRAA